MKAILSAFTIIALLATPALAGPGKGRWHKHYWHGGYVEYDRDEVKQEFWVGNCKIKRKWARDGDYEVERKCKRAWD